MTEAYVVKHDCYSLHFFFFCFDFSSFAWYSVFLVLCLCRFQVIKIKNIHFLLEKLVGVAKMESRKT